MPPTIIFGFAAATLVPGLISFYQFPWNPQTVPPNAELIGGGPSVTIAPTYQGFPVNSSSDANDD
jgi:hypothetical protein